jgi:hypothetical protein
MQRLINRRQQGDLGEISAAEWLTRMGATVFLPPTAVSLGGAKYAEFEIEPTAGIRRLVYREETHLESSPRLGEYPSGQRTAPVKRQAQPSQVRLLPPPLPNGARPIEPSKYERKLGQNCQAVINQKRRVTLPQQPFFAAGLQNGDRVRIRCDGAGRLILERADLADWNWPN